MRTPSRDEPGLFKIVMLHKGPFSGHAVLALSWCGNSAFESFTNKARIGNAACFGACLYGS